MKQLRACQTVGQLVLLLSGTFAASAPNAAKPVGDHIRQVVEPGAMFSRADPTVAALTKCQPRRGDSVAVLSIAAVAGMPSGLAAISVRSGACQGESGWMGIHRLTDSNVGR